MPRALSSSFNVTGGKALCRPTCPCTPEAVPPMIEPVLDVIMRAFGQCRFTPWISSLERRQKNQHLELQGKMPRSVSRIQENQRASSATASYFQKVLFPLGREPTRRAGRWTAAAVPERAKAPSPSARPA